MTRLAHIRININNNKYETKNEQKPGHLLLVVPCVDKVDKFVAAMFHFYAVGIRSLCFFFSAELASRFKADVRGRDSAFGGGDKPRHNTAMT